jgi:hypothetical protein
MSAQGSDGGDRRELPASGLSHPQRQNQWKRKKGRHVPGLKEYDAIVRRRYRNVGYRVVMWDLDRCLVFRAASCPCCELSYSAPCPTSGPPGRGFRDTRGFGDQGDGWRFVDAQATTEGSQWHDRFVCYCDRGTWQAWSWGLMLSRPE